MTLSITDATAVALALDAKAAARPEWWCPGLAASLAVHAADAKLAGDTKTPNGVVARLITAPASIDHYQLVFVNGVVAAHL